MDMGQHLPRLGLEDHVRADDVELAFGVKGDSLLRQLSAVPEPRKLKVQPFVGKDLALQCVLCVGRCLTAVLQAGIQRYGYGGTDAKIECVIIFLTARQLLEIEDISWVIRHPVSIIVGGIVIRSAHRALKGQGVRVAFGDKRADV
jgi:hypothetical protein